MTGQPAGGGPLAEFVGTRAGDVADAVLGVVAIAVRVPGARARIPGLVDGLIEALHAQALVAEAASDPGSGAVGATRLDSAHWLGSREAGAVVGCSDRWVRQLCARGLVAHRRIGAHALLVDVADLQRHLRGEESA